MKQKRVSPIEDALFHVKEAKDKSMFTKIYIDDYKGYGVIAEENIPRGTFLLEYKGEHISAEEGEKRHKEYNGAGSQFLYFYSFKQTRLCIDASKGMHLAKFVNDEHRFPNGKMKLVEDENLKPHLCLFAIEDIKPGDEICYDYGDPSSPWRKISSEERRKEMPCSIESHAATKDPAITSNCPVSGQGPTETNEEPASRTDQPQDVLAWDDSDRTRLCPMLVDSSESESDHTLSSGSEYHATDDDNLDSSDYEDTTFRAKKRKLTKSTHNQTIVKQISSNARPRTPKQGVNARASLQKECIVSNENINLTPEIIPKKTTEESPKFEYLNAVKTKIFVNPTSKKNSGKRNWDKKHCCLYCQKLISKLGRHLENCHINELEVAHAYSFPKKSKQRISLIREIGKKGNFKHNYEVIQEGNGELVVCRRPSNKTVQSPTNYVPCSMCMGYYLKKDLWRHKQNCRKEPAKESNKKESYHSNSKHLLPVPKNISENLKKTFTTMAFDSISLLIRNDPLILQLGEHFSLKTGHIPQCHNYVAQKMREVGRLVQTAASMYPEMTSCSNMISPLNFEKVIAAVLKCTGFDEHTHEFKSPSFALKLGHSLQKLSDIQFANAIKMEDSIRKKEIENFKTLLTLEWSGRVSTHALRQMNNKRSKKPQAIPLTQDIVKLHNHIQKIDKQVKVDVSKYGITLNTWKVLSKVTLCEVLVFNRRRQGEVHKLTIENYQTARTQVQDEILQALTETEKIAANRLTLIKTRGKRDRMVPILLTASMQKSIDLLIETRGEVGVNAENPFVFARCSQGSMEPLRGCDVLRTFAQESGAQKPEYLTSTQLRKHVATLSQLLNLKKNELEQLANHLGHDITVHRDFYRLPQDALQLAKVSKVLFALRKGEMHKYKGMTLSEIQLTKEDQFSDMSEEGSDEETDVQEESNPTRQNDSNTEPEASPQNHPALHERMEFGKSYYKIPWTVTEEEAIKKHTATQRCLLLKRVPNKKECDAVLADNQHLFGKRDWKSIKNKVRNMITAQKRKMEKGHFEPIHF